MRGMQVTVPSAGWKVGEDHPGEFNVGSPGGTSIKFWLDPIAANPGAAVAPGVGRTPAALIRWLRGNPNFAVSPPKTRRIAGGLAALSVDLDVTATAPREDPGCPGPCITWFVFGEPRPFGFGTGEGEPVRLYLATLGSGTSRHTFAVAVDTPSPAAFRKIAPVADRILASVKLPAKVTAG
jgi:hypothetical protein